MSKLLGHLDWHSGEYRQDPDENNIRPISVTDARIIMSWIAILNGAGMLREAVIMSRWKQESDEDMLTNLQLFMEANEIPEIDAEQAEGEGIGSFLEQMLGASPKMIDIEGKMMIMNFIHSVEKQDQWDGDEEVYLIIINKSPMPAKQAWYEDTVVKFFNKEDRDDYHEELKGKFIKQGIEFV